MNDQPEPPRPAAVRVVRLDPAAPMTAEERVAAEIADARLGDAVLRGPRPGQPGPEPVSPEMVSRLTELRDRHPGHRERYPDQVRPGPHLVRYTARVGSVASVEVDERAAVRPSVAEDHVRTQAAAFLTHRIDRAAADLTREILRISGPVSTPAVREILARFDEVLVAWRDDLMANAEITRTVLP